MAIVKMNRTAVIALQSDKKKIVDELQRFGMFQIDSILDDVSELAETDGVAPDGDGEGTNACEETLAKLKYSIDFIGRFCSVKKGLFAQKDVYTLTNGIQDSEYAEIDEIYQRCRALDDKINELKNYQAKLMMLSEQIEPWRRLDIPAEQLSGSAHMAILTGSVDKKKKEDFKTALLTEQDEVYFEEIGESKDETFLIVFALRENLEGVNETLKKNGWTKFAFPEDLMGTIEETLKHNEALKAQVEEEKNALIVDAQKEKSNLPFLEKAYDFESLERDKKQVVGQFAKTENTFAIQGWVPTDAVAELEKRIGAVTEYYALESNLVEDDPQSPVLLNNPSIVQPFESVTSQYSLPNPQEIDPDKIMSPFYFVFFGMMLGDAGYGIILAILTFVALKKMESGKFMKQMLGLIGLGGISTFIWGALFGGWFGMQLKPLWFVPMNEPMKMLMFCLALGVLQIYVGMGVSAYKKIRQGDTKSAILDSVPVYLFYTGLIMLTFQMLASMVLPNETAETSAVLRIAPSIFNAGKWVAIVGTIAMVLTQGRDGKNIFMKLFGGVKSLYGVTGFLGDVLSYSRLFALGLASAVIGTVINSMAGMISGSLIGKLFAVILLLGGHTFNIGINTLGAYVHSCRLQYVEFFGKFYEGDGRPFEPFAIKTKYVNIKNSDDTAA